MGVDQAVGDLSGRQRLVQAPVLLGLHPGVPVALFVRPQSLGSEFSLQLVFDGAPVEFAGDVDQASWLSADCPVLLTGPLQQTDELIFTLRLRRSGSVAFYRFQGVAVSRALLLDHRVYDILREVPDPLCSHARIIVIGLLEPRRP